MAKKPGHCLKSILASLDDIKSDSLTDDPMPKAMSC